jgi:hypothetical protein
LSIWQGKKGPRADLRGRRRPEEFRSETDLRSGLGHFFAWYHYKDEGFVERKIELDDEDLDRIIEEYLRLHAEFDFDEIEIEMNSFCP